MDVYWVSFDPSQGTKIQKTRPAVIISNNLFNEKLNRVIVAPLTSNIKNIFAFDCAINAKGKAGKIMLDQLRIIDKTRLNDKISSIDLQTLQDLERALKITLDLF